MLPVFITLAPQPKLDGKHCVFGEIVEGIELLDQIDATVQADKSTGVPNKQINILGCGRIA